MASFVLGQEAARMAKRHSDNTLTPSPLKTSPGWMGHSIAPGGHHESPGSSMPQQPTSLPPTPTERRPPANITESSWRRHYKKDSRYVMDLYTLTFDEGETVDEIETTTARQQQQQHPGLAGEHEFLSLAPSSSTLSSLSIIQSSPATGPLSLQGHPAATRTASSPGMAVMGLSTASSGPLSLRPDARTSLPHLETNLLKILARKIQDSEEVSFRKAKLLTKAYYRLLRESPSEHLSIRRAGPAPAAPAARRVGDASLRLSWKSLLKTEPGELRRIVHGLGNTVKALNDYLVDLLQDRDELLGQQGGIITWLDVLLISGFHAGGDQ